MEGLATYFTLKEMMKCGRPYHILHTCMVSLLYEFACV
ncbi:hypothetical protein T02_7452 [Trichinella nativa]|uniref:Uncharacterized protein n=1 Tax=Trichinella nativa TaxID=6335 RepID=A0A0V1KI39_9BILA|nr:hypothetical protein T02_7452 [Trichinella nativa]